MKIQFASDLHLEFKENSEYVFTHPLEVVGDILILAGDTHVFKGHSWEKHSFFDWCAGHYEQTYLIPGNHEFYGGVELDRYLEDFEMPLRKNVKYINNKSVLVGEAELFFTTLWSIIPPNEITPVQMGLTDCYRINYQGRSFNANDYERLHHLCKKWLAQALDTSTVRHKIVVTHHQPTFQVWDPRFISSPINSAFAVDMDRFIKRYAPEFWIYGHTHYNGGNGIVIGKTTLLCNQLGYIRHLENGTFRLNAYINLKGE